MARTGKRQTFIAVTHDSPSPAKSARAARLASALRDNLKRRKAQARGLEGQNAEREPGTVLSGPAHRNPPQTNPKVGKP